jgi:uncharacterized membrane protein
MSATEMPGPAPDAADPELQLVLPGKTNAAGEGVAWIGQGWKLFAKAPLMWIISLVILLIIAIALALVPLVGSLIFQVLNPVFSAGFVVACRAMERGGDFELEHLFAGFKRNFGSLAIVGLIFLALSVAMLLVFAMFFGFSILAAFMAGDPEQAMTAVAASTGTLLLGVLVTLALFIPVLMAYWFAPALVVMHGMAPVAAMKASLVASLRNFIPLLLWGIVMGVIMIVASIPFGLGLLVAVPMMIASTYAAYRAIFTEEPAAPAQRPVMVG